MAISLGRDVFIFYHTGCEVVEVLCKSRCGQVVQHFLQGVTCVVPPAELVLFAVVRQRQLG